MKPAFQRAVRLAFLAIINEREPIQRGDSGYLSLVLKTTVRSIQRDIKLLPQVYALIEQYNVLKQSVETVEKTHSISEAVKMVGINEYRIRYWAVNLQIGRKIKGAWRFTEYDIEQLKNRPDKRKPGLTRLSVKV